jgi:Domain of unknown function (DUF4116)
MLKAIDVYPLKFTAFQKALRNRREFVFKAFEGCGNRLPAENLANCSDFLRDYHDLVLSAVQLNGLSLRYANKRFLKREHIILAACTNNPLALLHADCTSIRSNL